MTITVKDIIIFVGGLGVGAAGMYFYAKDKFQKKADAEIAEMRQYVNDKVAECRGKTSAYQEQLDQYSLIAGGYIEDKAAPAEENIVDDEPEFTEDERPMTDDEYQEMKDEEIKNSPGPRIISEDDFADYRHHSKDTLLYFVEDSTLTDEDYNIVDDAAALFKDCLDYFYMDDSQEEIYVRNTRVGGDYYIKKVFDSYDNFTS